MSLSHSHPLTHSFHSPSPSPSSHTHRATPRHQQPTLLPQTHAVSPSPSNPHLSFSLIKEHRSEHHTRDRSTTRSEHQRALTIWASWLVRGFGFHDFQIWRFWVLAKKIWVFQIWGFQEFFICSDFYCVWVLWLLCLYF